jgi:SagB-type dehydrogenase family enzyme
LLAAVVEEESDTGPEEDLHAWCSPAAESLDPAEGEWARQVQRAGMIEAATARSVGARAEQSDEGPPAIGGALPLSREPLAGGPAVLAAIRRRRSTRRFLPGGRLSAEALGRMLAHAYLNGEAARRMLPECLRTWLVLTGVEGTADGIYRYEPEQHAIEPTRLGNASAVMHKTCLWQELGRDCTVAIVHTLDLPAATATHGERVYRTAHLDAGLIGQRLNMAALRLGYGASGIGGFFDDFVNELLQLGPRHAVVYITTIGVPG